TCGSSAAGACAASLNRLSSIMSREPRSAGPPTRHLPSPASRVSSSDTAMSTTPRNSDTMATVTSTTTVYVSSSWRVGHTTLRSSLRTSRKYRPMRAGNDWFVALPVFVGTAIVLSHPLPTAADARKTHTHYSLTGLPV